MASFTVFDNGRVVRGDPREILEALRQRASVNSAEIRALDVGGYADILIEDAPYFLESDLLKAMETAAFSDKFERALTYMAHMPTSGVRIMTVRAA